jgi:hypothetical protein
MAELEALLKDEESPRLGYHMGIAVPSILEWFRRNDPSPCKHFVHPLVVSQ